MKLSLGKVFTLAIVGLIAYLIYGLLQKGLVAGLLVELSRYQDINTTYLYLAIGFVLISFLLGWSGARFRVR